MQCTGQVDLSAGQCMAVALYAPQSVDRVCLTVAAPLHLISDSSPAGLWLNIPDYDAPTQMVKPKERNTRYVDAVLTIPRVSLRLSACHGGPSVLLPPVPLLSSVRGPKAPFLPLLTSSQSGCRPFDCGLTMLKTICLWSSQHILHITCKFDLAHAGHPVSCAVVYFCRGCLCGKCVAQS